MKNILLLCLSFCSIIAASAQNKSITFTSTDTALQTAFNCAKKMALTYKGKPGDIVGAWYESALPPRHAFCMRDVAHQTVGAEVLGLHAENKNMLSFFAKNISANKDWCSYWEINKSGNPAPEDYRNDKEFWYNLNANFDILNACWQLYLFTGDETYIKDKDFKNFYSKSANEFINSWVLQADSLLTRPAHPNAPTPFNEDDAFHRCRGLPSYSEGVQNVKMGVDLIAAIYRGLTSYAAILQANGDAAEAIRFTQKAKTYQQKIDADWWNDSAGLYNTYYSNNNAFGKEEGETFLLWFDALPDSTRKQKTLQHLLSRDWNVENLSYFPYIMYMNGYWNEAHNYMLHLTNPATERREYPEVSFGVIKGFTEGLMGISADARTNTISTLYRNKNNSISTLSNVPVLQTFITIKHSGNKQSSFTNNGNKTLTWRACFSGHYPALFVNKTAIKTTHEKDWLGNEISFVKVEVIGGKEVTVSANN